MTYSEKPNKLIIRGHILKAVVSAIQIFILISFVSAQTPGLIYKPAGSVLGRSVLDPNGDGFVSLTTSGFSGTDYGSNSELNMVPLPIIGAEPTGDLTTGSSGGATDIVSVGGNSGQSCYLLYKNVSGVNYLIVRFRLGGSSSSAKGYSLLLDIDGSFGTLLGSSNNPGYEKEVVMNTGNAGGIVVNTFSSTTGALTGTTTYDLDQYSQRSIALTTISSNSDYFYDFFIPYSALGLTSEPVRIAAATINSAGSGISGTKSDYNGVNDSKYGNNPLAIANALITTFPATSLTNLTDGASFSTPSTTAPYVNSGLTTVSTSVSGTSAEADGTSIQVYKNGVAFGSATTVSSGVWSISFSNGSLANDDVITAKATASGKTISAQSNMVIVSPCVMSTPVITSRTGGNISGTWSGSVTSNGSNVQIKIYTQDATGAFTLVPLTSTTYVVNLGTTWSCTPASPYTGSTFQSSNFFATAVLVSTGCESGKSDISKKTGGQTGTTTATPQINTATVKDSTGPRTIQVQNLDATASSLILYVNGNEVANTNPTTYAQNATYNFSITGLSAGDIITARAQSATTNYWISNISAGLVVTENTSSQSSSPSISGSYVAGSSKTVSGTSLEPAGTAISLYKAGSTLLGSATVDVYGNWSVTGLTLATNDVLTATAKATGKTVSAASTSVTVAASAPSAPTVTGSYQSGASSVTGTGGSGTVTVYVDGSPIGTVSASGAWTLSSIASGQIYKGAVINATNMVSGVESALSNSITATGVNSFAITTTSDGVIGTQVAGVAFDIKFTAKDGASGAGNTFTSFTSKVVVSSSSATIAGTGQTNAFTAGVYSPHSMNLTTAGSNKTITVISVDDPTAFGTTTIAVIDPNAVYKLVLNAPANVSPNTRAAYTVTRKDAYDNLTITGTSTAYLSASLSSGKFYDAASGGNEITSVNIASGQSAAQFWFAATNAGSYSITASDANPANGITGLQDNTDDILVGTVWTGSTSTDWATNTNWEGNQVPASGAEIVVPGGSSNYPILDQNRTIGGIYIGTGATTRLNGKVLTVQGIFNGSGKFIGQTNSGINLTGTGSAGTIFFDTTTPGTSNFLSSFTINRSSTGSVTLGSNLEVSTLTLTNGNIDVDAYTLTSSTNVGGATSSYVKTSGSGVLKTNIPNGSTVPFPVGNSAFNPVTIVNNTNAADDFSVMVLDEVYANGNGNGNNATLNATRIKRTWDISKGNHSANAGNGVDFIFDWNNGEELAQLTNYSLYHYTGGKWNEEKTNGAKASNSNRVTFSSYKGTFSPFGVLEGNSVLPVQWKSLTAEKKEKSVQIKWETAQEVNAKDFTLQRSSDGKNWKGIATLTAKGNMHAGAVYDYTDYQYATGVNYYRVAQRDLDEKTNFSAIVKVNMEQQSSDVVILGNPVYNKHLVLRSMIDAQINILNVSGKSVNKGNIVKGINDINLIGLANGTYYLNYGGQTRLFMIQ